MSDADAVERARDGDRDALSDVLESLRGPLHRLATAMFWDREDAEDATQEALIAVMTNLAGFRGESSLSTWAHRIAVRLYLRRRQSRTERAGLSFDMFASDLLDGLASADSDRADAELLAEEVRIGCTLAVMQCLDRSDRLVFVLGDVLALGGEQAAEIVGVTHAAYRKRLSRVRLLIRTAVAANCGIVNPTAACRCHRRIHIALEQGRVQPARLRFARQPDVDQAKQQIQDLHDVAALFRSAGVFDSPDDLTARVLQVLDNSRGPLLDQEPPT